jgi:hypothetical protein
MSTSEAPESKGSSPHSQQNAFNVFCYYQLWTVVPVVLLVSVLVTGPKVRGFKPGRRDGFLRGIETRSTPPYGGEVKPSASLKILRHVKITSKYEQSQIHHILRQIPPDLLLDDSACGAARELWLTNQGFSSVDIIPPWLSIPYVYHVRVEKQAWRWPQFWDVVLP